MPAVVKTAIATVESLTKTTKKDWPAVAATRIASLRTVGLNEDDNKGRDDTDSLTTNPTQST